MERNDKLQQESEFFQIGGVKVGQNFHQVVEYLVTEENPYLIILFGSYAKGMARADSDVDIAYWSEKEPNSYHTFLLAQQLAVLLGRDVDLVDLKSASTVLRVQIIAHGKVLHCTDDKRRAYFFMRAFKEYALLNEERAVILERICKEGSVYGNGCSV